MPRGRRKKSPRRYVPKKQRRECYDNPIEISLDEVLQDGALQGTAEDLDDDNWESEWYNYQCQQCNGMMKFNMEGDKREEPELVGYSQCQGCEQWYKMYFPREIYEDDANDMDLETDEDVFEIQCTECPEGTVKFPTSGGDTLWVRGDQMAFDNCDDCGQLWRLWYDEDDEEDEDDDDDDDDDDGDDEDDDDEVYYGCK